MLPLIAGATLYLRRPRHRPPRRPVVPHRHLHLAGLLRDHGGRRATASTTSFRTAFTWILNLAGLIATCAVRTPAAIVQPGHSAVPSCAAGVVERTPPRRDELPEARARFT